MLRAEGATAVRYGHTGDESRIEGAPSFAPCSIIAIMAQWCFPSRRQHADRVASALGIASNRSIGAKIDEINAPAVVFLMIPTRGLEFSRFVGEAQLRKSK